MPSKSELAVAWQIRQARSKGFRALVRKEVPAETEADEIEAPAAAEAAPEVTLASAEAPAATEATEAPETPEAPSRIASIIKRIRLSGLK